MKWYINYSTFNAVNTTIYQQSIHSNHFSFVSLQIIARLHLIKPALNWLNVDKKIIFVSVVVSILMHFLQLLSNFIEKSYQNTWKLYNFKHINKYFRFKLETCVVAIAGNYNRIYKSSNMQLNEPYVQCNYSLKHIVFWPIFGPESAQNFILEIFFCVIYCEDVSIEYDIKNVYVYVASRCVSYP